MSIRSRKGHSYKNALEKWTRHMARKRAWAIANSKKKKR